MKTITPLGRRLLVQRCSQSETQIVDGHKFSVLTIGPGAGLAVPDRYGDTSNMYEILEVSQKCEIFRQDHIGKFVQAPEWSKDHNRITVANEIFLTDETQARPAVFWKDGDAVCVEPLSDTIVVEMPEKVVESGGVLLADDGKIEQIVTAKVIYAGPGRKYAKRFASIWLNVNDVVRFNRNDAFEFVLNGRKVAIMQETAVILSIET